MPVCVRVLSVHFCFRAVNYILKWLELYESINCFTPGLQPIMAEESHLSIEDYFGLEAPYVGIPSKAILNPYIKVSLVSAAAVLSIYKMVMEVRLEPILLSAAKDFSSLAGSISPPSWEKLQPILLVTRSVALIPFLSDDILTNKEKILYQSKSA